MTRALHLATVLASAAAAAGSVGVCAAQPGSGRQETSLGAAVAEAWRTPFHASGRSEPWETLLGGAETDGPRTSGPFRPQSEEVQVPRPVVAFTFFASGVGHLAGSYLFFYCADNDSYRSSIAGCIVGPVIPFLAVAAPAAGSELGPRKAFKASAFGWLGGVALFSVVRLASESISNVGAGLLSGAVHGIVATAVLRRP